MLSAPAVATAAAAGSVFSTATVTPFPTVAVVTVAVIGIGIKVMGRLREGGYVPFGPFLALGGLTAMVFCPAAILRAIGL